VTVPRATYRLQLGPDLGFADAAAQCDYLAALGVSHVYTSPALQAEAGSSHGYDQVDPGAVSSDLGGDQGWAGLGAAARRHGLGLVLDIVPNHMSIASAGIRRGNRWWWDVLENGPSSHYAAYFDVDWVSITPGADALEENRILLPVLGERYGAALLGGQLSVARRGERFVAVVGDRELPLAPRSLAEPLRLAAEAAGSDELAFVADALAALPLPTATDRESTRRRHRDKAVLGQALAGLLERRPPLAAAVDRALAGITADPAALDALLERQNWRLASWRVATSELGYRRFFDVQTLVGLRVEVPAVFEDTHHRVVGWLADGTLDGVRVDHPDGLRDPAEYTRRLRAAAPDAWIVVEKILHRGERLPEDWPVDGTTGYDFIDLVTGVLVDPAGGPALTALAERVTGEPQDLATLIATAKQSVLRDVLAAELERLVALLQKAARRRATTRDYTRRELTDALTAVLVEVPVYRTYVVPGAPVGDVDRGIIDAAAARAAARADLEPDLVEFVRQLLALELSGDAEAELAVRAQQVTGAVTAKAVEDTAYYRHAVLLALDEVGCTPEPFGVPLADFHRELAARAGSRSMLATSTHDTKRSEDVRARLAVLSEVPAAWEAAVTAWRARAARHRGRLDDPHAEYWLFQTLVGAWPIDAARATAYMEKAVREAKRRTSWTQRDEAYEEALRAFIAGVLGDRELVASIEAFVAHIAPAGWQNSLTQTLLKLTAPGVPDLYQGTELWDLSLVDPDNRRPVDYAVRRAALARLDGMAPAAIVAAMAEGLPKLHVIRETLRLRAARPALFAGGASALAVTGAQASRVIAVGRGDLAAIAPRWSMGLADRGWGDTRLELPAGRWTHAFTKESIEGGVAGMNELLAHFPVALLWRAS
jgi:(1->4)-alpha-D-glucan 1-alpha-D-glucosylmutase